MVLGMKMSAYQHVFAVFWFPFALAVAIAYIGCKLSWMALLLCFADCWCELDQWIKGKTGNRPDSDLHLPGRERCSCLHLLSVEVMSSSPCLCWCKLILLLCFRSIGMHPRCPFPSGTRSTLIQTSSSTEWVPSGKWWKWLGIMLGASLVLFSCTHDACWQISHCDAWWFIAALCFLQSMFQ